MDSIFGECLKIVIVDNDAIFRDIICMKVSSICNFKMMAISSGDELINLLQKEQIDCIILDYNIGDESGLAIQVRLDDCFVDHPPTIMITSDDRQRTAIKAFQIGVNDYLPKVKLQPGHIVASVTKAVGRNRKAMLQRDASSPSGRRRGQRFAWPQWGGPVR